MLPYLKKLNIKSFHPETKTNRRRQPHLHFPLNLPLLRATNNILLPHYQCLDPYIFIRSNPLTLQHFNLWTKMLLMSGAIIL